MVRSRATTQLALVVLTAMPAASLAQDNASIFVRPVDPTIDLTTASAVTLEVVVDAANLTGDFFAFNQYDFDLRLTAQDEALPLAQVTDFADQPQATAPTTGVPAQGDPWTGGRRPGAFPFASIAAGGSQQGPYGAEIVQVIPQGIRLTSGFEVITGRQGAPAAPDNNTFINQSREYEVFRFTVERTPANGELLIALSDAIINIYPSGDSAFNRFLEGFETRSLTLPALIPSPATPAVLVSIAALAIRRRR
ncbi:MAG: hypothetical protein AAGK04_05685 [Planctomycetota bacterium]